MEGIKNNVSKIRLLVFIVICHLLNVFRHIQILLLIVLTESRDSHQKKKKKKKKRTCLFLVKLKYHRVHYVVYALKLLTSLTFYIIYVPINIHVFVVITTTFRPVYSIRLSSAGNIDVGS